MDESGVRNEFSYKRDVLFDITNHISRLPNVCDIFVDKQGPVTPVQIAQWEQKYQQRLPLDMKTFYFTSNGFCVSWNIKLKGLNITAPISQSLAVPHSNSPGEKRLSPRRTTPPPVPPQSSSTRDDEFELGKMEINSLERLRPLVTRCGPLSGLSQTLNALQKSSRVDPRSSFAEIPSFGSGSFRYFDIATLADGTRICLVCQTEVPGGGCGNEVKYQRDSEVWCLDAALRWYFLAPTFSHYYRLLLMHLGLPNWTHLYRNLSASKQDVSRNLPPQMIYIYELFAPGLLKQVHGRGPVHKSSDHLKPSATSSTMTSRFDPPLGAGLQALLGEKGVSPELMLVSPRSPYDDYCRHSSSTTASPRLARSHPPKSANVTPLFNPKYVLSQTARPS